MNNFQIYISPSSEEDLKTLFPGRIIGIRELKFLVGYFRIECNLANMTKNAIVERVLIDLNFKKDQISLIDGYFDLVKVDAEKFEFIGKSKSRIWLTNKAIEALLNRAGIQLPQDIGRSGLVYTLGVQDLFIFLMDFWRADIQEKNAFLEWVKKEFDKYFQETKFLAWYEKEVDRPQIAFDYLRMKDSFLTATSFGSDLEGLRILFYEKILTGEDVRMLDLQIKRYYHNKKSRENKATKQANFSLSDQSIKNIEEMAGKYRVTKSMVVDAIFKSQSIMKQVDKALESRLEFSLPDYPPSYVKNRIDD